ncbi:MAG: HAMP domain-containing protein [Alphaproteobacteria bacterium]|nr:HAMP domain-containing protein [Alphaproteobacteria bacterium]
MEHHFVHRYAAGELAVLGVFNRASDLRGDLERNFGDEGAITEVGGRINDIVKKMLAEFAASERKEQADTVSVVSAGQRNTVIGLIAGLIGGIILALLLGGVIAKPIVGMTATMERVAKGDRAVEVPGRGRRDEVGTMADAVQVFKDAAIQNERLQSESETTRKRQEEERNAEAAKTRTVVDEVGRAMGALVRGDLTHRITADLAAEYAKIKQDYNSTADRLSEIVGSIVSSANQIGHAASEVSQASHDLAGRTEQQAANLEETAAAMEEMTATVNKNAKNSGQTNQLVAGAQHEAVAGGHVVTNAVTAMGSIENSSRQISEIVNVIDDIAFQTNLLALNAAVEAARAGDVGKGFAVVATEVRSLAQRSSEAAKEIKQLITTSNEHAAGGVKLVNDTGTALGAIVISVEKIASMMGEIAGASKEQATGLGKVNSAVTQMDEMTQQNAAMVEQITAAARSLATEAGQMVQLVSFFKLNDGAPINQPIATTT